MQQYRTSINTVSTSLLLLVFVNACTLSEPLRPEPYENGFIALEAGQTGKNNASVSFIGQNKKATNNIFQLVNSRNLGDLLRSYTEIDGKGYLIVSNSDKIEVVENSTFRSISFIDKGVEQCRYMIAAPAQDGFFLKGYVSYWGGKTLSPGVAVIDLTSRKVIKAISVSAGPEQIALVGDQLFVTNSGGTGVGSTVSVINTTTDQLVSTISVGNVPTAIAYDAARGLLHVLCSGRPVGTNANGTTTAELVRINPTTKQVISRIIIGGRPITGNPSTLVFNPVSDRLYFLLRGFIYETLPGATSISVDKPFLNQPFTSLAVQPNTGILYGGYAKDSTSKGIIRRFQSNGLQIDSIAANVVPTAFYFK